MKKICAFFLLFLLAACSDSKQIRIPAPQNQGIYLRIDGLHNKSHRKLAVIQHGLASNMEHPAVQTAKKAFLDNHYVVITFDSRYSMGQSGNDVQNARLSTFIEDLQTVINWAEKQSFYAEPLALAGHSLGGASVVNFAAEHPDKINVLVPMAPVTSGRSWEKSCLKNMTDFCQQWQKDGTYQYTAPKTHQTVVIPYAVITDCYNYNAEKLAPKITADTLLIAAENDIVVDLTDLQNLAPKLNRRNLTIIKSGDHNFGTLQNLTDLYQAVNTLLN